MPNLSGKEVTFARDQRINSEEATANITSQNKAIANNLKGRSHVKSHATKEGEVATAVGELYVTEVKIPEKVLYMLQYGAFAQAEGARKAASELRELGMAAVEEHLEQHRVYAAIAPSKEDAMGLSSFLKNKQVDLYVRTLHRPAVDRLIFRGDAEAVRQFIAQSDAVNEWLMSQSIAYLEKNASEAFSTVGTEQLQREHIKWTRQMGVVEKGIPNRSKTAWVELVRGMNTAISALNEYNKHPSLSHLWKVQQAVIVYQAAETAWLATMKV